MFVQYFKLAEQPFGATPDPRFLFESATHREALASLYCAFHGNRGFTALIAEPGMGKTTLLFEFMDHIRERAKTVFLFNTLCDPADLISLILRDLDITPKQSAAEQYQQLNNVLATEAREGRRFVLIIDEAQNLSIRALEAIRLLTNFETPRAKLMQIVLAGQPQLADNLSRPEVTQLRQRVSTLCRLTPFSVDEVSAYIEHRVVHAGYTQCHLFTPAAIALIADASHGIPRNINTYCFNALCLCRARKLTQVTEDMVAEVIRDLQLPVTRSTPSDLHPVPEVITHSSVDATTKTRSSWGRPLRYAVAILLGTCFALTGFVDVPAIFHPLRMTANSASGLIADGVSAKLQSSGNVLASQSTMPVAQIASEWTMNGAGTVRAPIAVTIVPGDTLQSIAANHIGSFDSTVLKKIRVLNPDLTDPNLIKSGRTILLPKPGDQLTPNATARTKP